MHVHSVMEKALTPKCARLCFERQSFYISTITILESKATGRAPKARQRKAATMIGGGTVISTVSEPSKKTKHIKPQFSKDGVAEMWPEIDLQVCATYPREFG